MFEGLDEVNWAAMRHAYGPASDMPDLLRGLVSADPAVREAALHGMHAAVHHQGDVYPCTLAAIPFLLEAAAMPGVPGRDAVLELLADIGGADVVGAPNADEPADEPAARIRRAREEIGAAYDVLVSLLDDADAAVRRAVPRVLLIGGADDLLGALQERVPREPDVQVREALVRAVATLAARLGTVSIGSWLAQLVRTEAPSLRLVALTELARCAPDAMPGDIPAMDLVDAVYAENAPGPAPAGFVTDTLPGVLRQFREREAAGRHAPRATTLVHALANALGDRVSDRIALLTALLRTSRWESRYDAITPAKLLIAGWRGSYAELVTLLGEQLLVPEPRLREFAATSFDGLGELARPAADSLARSLAGSPREAMHTRPTAWVTLWPNDSPSLGCMLIALAELADPRALPMLRWALERADMPRNVGFAIGSLGSLAVDLVPVIRERLRNLPSVERHDTRRAGLVYALGRIGPAAAAAVPELLDLVPAEHALIALGRVGSRDALPVVHELLHHATATVAMSAATALWQIDRDPEPVIAVFARYLDGRDWEVSRAAEGIGMVGPAAGAQERRLRALLDGPDPHGWRRTAAATALWRVSGDADTAVRALIEAWKANVHTRRSVAETIAEMGPRGWGAEPLLREELGRTRRHARPGSSAGIVDDEALVRACRSAVAATGNAAGGSP